MGQKSGKLSFDRAEGHTTSKEATNGGPVQNGTEVTKGTVDADVPLIDDVPETRIHSDVSRSDLENARIKRDNDEECNGSLTGRVDEGNPTVSKPAKKKKHAVRNWVGRTFSGKRTEEEKHKATTSPKPVAEPEDAPAATGSTEDTVVTEHIVVSCVESSATVDAATSNVMETPVVTDVPESAEHKEAASSVQPGEQTESALPLKHHVEIIHLPPTDSDVDSNQDEAYTPVDTNNTYVKIEQCKVTEVEVVDQVQEGVEKKDLEREEEKVHKEEDKQVHEEVEEKQVHEEVEEQVHKEEKQVHEEVEEQVHKEEKQVHEEVEEKQVHEEAKPSSEDNDSDGMVNEAPDEAGDNRQQADKVNGVHQEAEVANGKQSMLSKSDDEELTGSSPRQPKLSSIDHDKELTNESAV